LPDIAQRRDAQKYHDETAQLRARTVGAKHRAANKGEGESSQSRGGRPKGQRNHPYTADDGSVISG